MRRADLQAKSRLASRVMALALGFIAILAAAAPAASVAPELSASLSAGELRYGDTLTVSGRVLAAGQPLGGVPLTLESSAYPFHGFVPVAHLTSAADGVFSFLGVRPDRNTRLRVVSDGTPATIGPVLAVTVDPRVSSGARSLGPGQVRLTLRVRHTLAAGSSPVSVWWFLAARRSRVYRLAAVTSTRELSPGVSYASVKVDPPSKRFVYRVCMNPPWEQAMGPSSAHRTCPHGTFVIGPRAG
jgi:hypothetical protein